MAALRRHLPGILGASAFWALLFGAYLLFGQRRPQAQPIQIQAPAPSAMTPAPLETPTPSPLRVYVSGEVLTPGVYRLPPDSLVQDAVLAAGGGTAAADLVAVNLAHPLVDGEQIYVPKTGEAAPPPVLSSQPTAEDAGFSASDLPAQPLDLNTATLAELETLPGVGPKTAQAIIEGRPYGAVEDLLRVKGIGEATLEKLRPFVTVR
jgi:competence protein ComEA